MYRHCLFCQRDLGTNDVIEGLPIGRRLAFDESKARLWVICTKCERWNLTPFDSPLEAIEQCEREFRGTKLRVSTENIGLARVTEGLVLIRIGEPMRPEMAAWRYGDQFGRRQRRHALVAGAGVAAVGAAYAGLSAIGVGGGVLWYGYSTVLRRIVDRANRIVVVTTDGRLVDVVPSAARNALVRMDAGTVQLSLESKGRTERWHGEEARRSRESWLPGQMLLVPERGMCVARSS